MKQGLGLHPSLAKLQAFGLGRLDPEEAAKIERHVACCAQCCQQLEAAPGDSFVQFLQNNRPASSVPDSAPISQKLAQHPRYQLMAVIGKGGLGTVYKAKDRFLGRMVALKVIDKQMIARPELSERFAREVQVIARLSHPNIVAACDADLTGSDPFLVMELVEGINLAQLVKSRGPLPTAEACDYARQAALGLQHASLHAVVHRDIKPQNLIRTPAGQIKILDFGLALLGQESKGRNRLTALGAILGTPDYIAPEQAGDAHASDIRADLYSLGCTLYFLLTGQVPFPGGSPADKLHKHAAEEPQPLMALRPDLPGGLAMIVARMMAKQPDDRFQTPLEVAEALDLYAGPGVPGASSLPANTSATIPGNWLAAMAISAVAVLALVAVLCFLMLRHEDGPSPVAQGNQQPPPLRQPGEPQPATDNTNQQGPPRQANAANRGDLPERPENAARVADPDKDKPAAGNAALPPPGNAALPPVPAVAQMLSAAGAMASSIKLELPAAINNVPAPITRVPVSPAQPKPDPRMQGLDRLKDAAEAQASKARDLYREAEDKARDARQGDREAAAESRNLAAKAFQAQQRAQELRNLYLNLKLKFDQEKAANRR